MSIITEFERARNNLSFKMTSLLLNCDFDNHSDDHRVRPFDGIEHLRNDAVVGNRHAYVPLPLALPSACGR